ncbi:MAG TPA: hypothetical protein PKD72_08005 [Gemmatales bacterium]|nr:hypothetical protein [Gemmatales bacterium]
MKYITIWTSLLLLATLSATWADEKDEARKELEKFQGEWKLSEDDTITLKFTGEEYEFHAMGVIEKGKMKFRPGTNPRQVDIDITSGPDAGKKQVGIYTWKNDTTVQFTLAEAGKDKRPEKPDEEGYIALECEKVKK